MDDFELEDFEKGLEAATKGWVKVMKTLNKKKG